MVGILNLVLLLFSIIVILLIVLIALRSKDGSYISSLKKSIQIKKLQLTERALSMDLDEKGFPSIEKLVSTGKLIQVDEEDKPSKVENRIGFK